jgi:hypothetical protein
MGVYAGGSLARGFTAFIAVISMTLATASGWTAGPGLQDERRLEAPMSAEKALPREASQDRAEVAKLLLDGGADVNAADQSGRTALMHASLRGHDELAAILVRRGADVNLPDKRGTTSLMVAVEKNNVGIVRLILSKGANVNAKDRNGDTALMRACRTGAPEMVRLLLNKGADVNAADRRGRTALDVASDEQVKRILKEHGAKPTKPRQPDRRAERTREDRFEICGTVDKMIAIIAQLQTQYAQSEHPGDPANMEMDPATRKSMGDLHAKLRAYARGRVLNRALERLFLAKILLGGTKKYGAASPEMREKAAALCEKAVSDLRKRCPSVSRDLCSAPGHK